MPTYTIVPKDTSPLGTNEIAAGDKIAVSDGDIYIIGPKVDSNVEFESPNEKPVQFDVQVNQSNPNDFEIKFGKALSPNLSIGDKVNIADVDISASETDSMQVTIGNGVSLGKYDGSKEGDDTLTIGDDFFTRQEIKTNEGDDYIRIGDNARLHELKTDKGDDTIIIGDDLATKKITTGEGDDLVRLGSDAFYGELKGDEGNDTIGSPDTHPDAEDFETVVCFARGTRILTDQGEIPVQHLSRGDLVKTADHGMQPIRWIGSVTVTGHGKLAPIRIRKGALGNHRALRVSPQHRMLLQGWQVQLLFGTNDVLVPAKYLVNDLSIRPAPVDKVEYFHILFDQHEVIYSEGAPSESLHPGDTALAGMAGPTRDEILMLFPQLANGWHSYGSAARTSLKSYEGQVLARYKTPC